jgi:Zn-dependent M28 family amino/carboxypeptidase
MFGALALMLIACGADAQNRRPPGRSDAPSQPRTITPVAPVKFDSNRAWTDLERQVAFGPRPAGSAALAQTRQYIERQLQAIGVAHREQTFNAMTPAGTIRMTNVIATIPGRRPERIGLATHYDTKRFAEFTFLGASDAASSTAAVLELARVLVHRRNEFTIELLFLDGEEAVNTEWRDPDNTYGSKHYVKAAKDAGTLGSLKALILLDMIGDRDLDIRPDSNSAAWLNAIVWGSAERLGYRSTFVPVPFTVEDDHLPFVEAGVPSIDIIDLDYPQWHTAQDDLEHVSARSLQTVGDVVLDALPAIETQLATQP